MREREVLRVLRKSVEAGLSGDSQFTKALAGMDSSGVAVKGLKTSVLFR